MTHKYSYFSIGEMLLQLILTFLFYGYP